MLVGRAHGIPLRHLSLLFLLPLLCLFLTACAKPSLHQSHQGEGSAREGILLVAFGTSVPEAEVSLKAVDAAFKAAFPDSPVVWAYTSQIIRKKLAQEGRPVGSISEGLASLAQQNVDRVRVQSLHVMAGEEFSALERAVLLDVQAHPGRFSSVFLGRPMLESRADCEALAKAVLSEYTLPRKKSAALVLMGHGQEHGRAGLTFEGARSVFQSANSRVFMATVEGARNFEELLDELKSAKVRTAVLAPLMLVAGDHARNDLAGDEEDSWASQLKRAGISSTAILKGLGELASARDLLVRHARETQDDLTKEPRKQ